MDEINTDGSKYLTFNDVCKTIINGVMNQVHTSIPGKIVDFDVTNCTATVKPLVKMTNKDGVTFSVAQIFKVPVMFPRTKKAAITYPINKDDTVLLVFAERCLDEWLSGSGNEVSPSSARKHDLNDCIAIPGLYAFGKGKLATNNTDFQIQHDGNIVIETKGGSKIEINDATNTISIKPGTTGKIELGNHPIAFCNDFPTCPLLGPHYIGTSLPGEIVKIP
jgi:hypothetical protein